jgi:hypothetical protein
MHLGDAPTPPDRGTQGLAREEAQHPRVLGPNRPRLRPKGVNLSGQVQRYIAELEQAGLVQRIERRAAHRGKITNEYDLGGLAKRLGWETRFWRT